MASYFINWHTDLQAVSFQDAARQAAQRPEIGPVFLVVNCGGRYLLFDRRHLPAEEDNQPVVCLGCGRDNADSIRLDHRCKACAEDKC